MDDVGRWLVVGRRGNECCMQAVMASAVGVPAIVLKRQLPVDSRQSCMRKIFRRLAQPCTTPNFLLQTTTTHHTPDTTMKIATQVTLTLQTDLSEAHAQNHPSGFMIATKLNQTQEKNVSHFLWISDVNSVQLTINNLVAGGYDADSMVYIPFSSKENFVKTYPYLTSSYECADGGLIRAYQQPTAATAAADAASVPVTLTKPTKNKKRKRAGPRINKHAILTNDMRDELHIQIYKYFQWLLHLLNENTTTQFGRRIISECNLSVLGVQSILSAVESIISVPNTGNINDMATANINSDHIPLLEQVIEEELYEQTSIRLQKSQEPKVLQGQHYNFDEMFAKLEEFKMQKGHCNVPSRYKDNPRLSKWVMKLREKKSELSKRGQDYETPLPNRKLSSRTLTKERIDQLEALGFAWSLKTKPTVPWETRFQELLEYYSQHGSWPTRKDGSLGWWVHNQRNYFSCKDKHFMAERFRLLDEIGFDWDPAGKRNKAK